MADVTHVIDIKVDPSGAQTGITNIGSHFDGLKKRIQERLKTGVDTATAAQDLNRLDGQIRAIRQRVSQRLRLGVDTSSLTSGLNAAKAAAHSFGQGVRQAATAALSGIDRLKSQIFSLKAAFLSFSAGLLVRDFINVGMTFESIETRLDGITGSTKKTGQALEFIKRITADTSLELDETANAYVKLAAAGLDAERLLPKFMEGVARFDGNGETLNRINHQLTQMVGKNKILAEDLNVIAETGIPVYDLLREELKLNDKQMQDLSKSGLDVITMINGLADAIERRYKGSAVAQSRTLTGIISNIRDSWTLFQKDIMDGGLFNYLKANADLFRKRLSETFQDNKEAARNWAQATMDGIDNVVMTVFGLIDAINRLKKTLDGLATIPIYSQISSTIDAAVQTAKGAGAVLRNELSFKEFMGAKNPEELKKLLEKSAQGPGAEGTLQKDWQEWIAERKKIQADFPAEREKFANSSPGTKIKQPGAVSDGSTDKHGAKIADALKDLEQQAQAAEVIKEKVLALGAISPDALKRQQQITQQLEAFKKTVADNDGKLTPDMLQKADTFITRSVDAEAEVEKFVKQTEHREKIQERINDLTKDNADLEELLAAARSSTATSTEELNRQMDVLTKFQEARRALTDKELAASPEELETIRQKINAQSQLKDAYNKTLHAREAKESLTRDLDLEGEKLKALIGQQALARREREIEAEVLDRVLQLTSQKIALDDKEIAGIRAQVTANHQLKETYEAMNHPLKELGEQTETTLKDLKDKTLEALGSIEDALVEMASGGAKNWKDSLLNMAKALNSDILRMTIRKSITAPLAKWLNGELDDGAKEGGWANKYLGVKATNTPTAKATDPLSPLTESLTRTQSNLDPLNLSLSQYATTLQANTTDLMNANAALPPFTAAIEAATQRLAQLGQNQDSGSSGMDLKKLLGGNDSKTSQPISTNEYGTKVYPDSDQTGIYPGFAKGGLVTSKTLAWVGEEGPELIVPLKKFAMGGIMGGGGMSAGLSGITGSLGGIGGAVGATAIPMALNYLMDMAFGSPEERQRKFARAQEDYQRAFEQTTGPRGHIMIGGVDAFTNLNWASKVPGALGYLKAPKLEETSMIESFMRQGLSMAGSIGGAKLGNWGGNTLAGMTGGQQYLNSYGTRVFSHSATSGMYPGASFAMGGIMTTDGPLNLRAYDRGGIATSPQLALFGEGSTPEAFVPLPDGRTIPVTMRGHQDLDDSPTEDRRPTVINFHVTTPDANSFRQSQPQIEGRMVSAMSRARKRNA